MAPSDPPRLNEADLAVLAEIRAGFARDGYAPTVREMTSRLGYRWPQSVQRRVERLVQAGELQRRSGQRRTLVPTRAAGVRRTVRWITFMGASTAGTKPTVSGRMLLPLANLLDEGEDGLAFVAERSVAGGPNAGDVVYCAVGRKVGAGDLLAVRSADGRVQLRRQTDSKRRGRGPEQTVVIGVVVAWLRRVSAS